MFSFVSELICRQKMLYFFYFYCFATNCGLPALLVMKLLGPCVVEEVSYGPSSVWGHRAWAFREKILKTDCWRSFKIPDFWRALTGEQIWVTGPLPALVLPVFISLPSSPAGSVSCFKWRLGMPSSCVWLHAVTLSLHLIFDAKVLQLCAV